MASATNMTTRATTTTIATAPTALDNYYECVRIRICIRTRASMRIRARSSTCARIGVRTRTRTSNLVQGGAAAGSCTRTWNSTIAEPGRPYMYWVVIQYRYLST